MFVANIFLGVACLANFVSSDILITYNAAETGLPLASILKSKTSPGT